MRYLKRFSETLDESSSNESHTDDIIENVKDILLPINDMGYDISVTYDEDYFRLIIRVVSWGDTPLFINDEVRDEFMRMCDYLKSEGYKSIKALLNISNLRRQEIELDELMDINHINMNHPIVNLLFVAKKIL